MAQKMFKETTKDLGNIKMGAKGVPVFFEFDSATKDDIASYEENGVLKYCITGCSCTDFEVKEDGVHAKYNDGGNTLGKGSKVLTVYFTPSDSSVPIRVKNKRGVNRINTNLASTRLTFTFNRER